MKKIRIIFGVIFIIIYHISILYSLEFSEINKKANLLYQKGDYKSALEIYNTLLKKGIKTSSIYFNLGNCYLKLNKIGLAIYYYTLAHKLAPRDADILYNLKYARGLRKDYIPSNEKTLFIKVILSWYNYLNLNELILTSIILYILGIIFISINFFYKKEWLKLIGIILIIVSLIFFLSSYIKYKNYYFCNKGVVIKKEVPIRTGNGKFYIISFKLHDGAEFYIDEIKGEWVKIRIDKDKKGWIFKKYIKIYNF